MHNIFRYLDKPAVWDPRNVVFKEETFHPHAKGTGCILDVWDGDYRYIYLRCSGTLEVDQTMDVSVLLVGGGSGSSGTIYTNTLISAGGAGGGDVREFNLTLEPSIYTIIVGEGGVGGQGGWLNEFWRVPETNTYGTGGGADGYSAIVGVVSCSEGLAPPYSYAPAHVFDCVHGGDSPSGYVGALYTGGATIGNGGAGFTEDGSAFYILGGDYYGGNGGDGILSSITGEYYGAGGGSNVGYIAPSIDSSSGVPGLGGNGPNSGGGGQGNFNGASYPWARSAGGSTGGSGLVVVKYKYK